jgi:hypothetical protein
MDANENGETTLKVNVAGLRLDLAAGALLAAAEMYGDWYRDPWSWPELGAQFVESLDAEADLMLARNARGEYHLAYLPAFHLIDVPKSWLGVRPVVVQDSASRLAFLSATQAGLDKLHSSLPDWRKRGGDIVASGGPEWAAYVACLPSPDHRSMAF